ncbi:hypothetical protein GW17_00012258 [Ensete ventricosum]|nr:hypothetical protein GW17_00012258 [Ensete ventricosum]
MKWETNSSSFGLKSRSVAADGFGLTLARKLNLNSLASWSKDEIERGSDSCTIFKLSPEVWTRMLSTSMRRICPSVPSKLKRQRRAPSGRSSRIVSSSGKPGGAELASEVSCSGGDHLVPNGSSRRFDRGRTDSTRVAIELVHAISGYVEIDQGTIRANHSGKAGAGPCRCELSHWDPGLVISSKGRFGRLGIARTV